MAKALFECGLDMSWHSDSKQVAKEKESLDLEITRIVVSIQEQQSRAQTIEEKQELYDRLFGSVRSWLPMK